ncbi:MAG TPA: NUDIX hydrolase [Candidatus Saccharimonadales bacterium]|jgi:ADP-ribose pyrophosphatase YjhB (NUDIX family)
MTETNADLDRNPRNLREINRRIASLVVISSDGKILMGRKDPSKGGVYADAWHIPGGGIKRKIDGMEESLEEAARREGQEEVVGLDLTGQKLTPIPFIGHGESVKTLDAGEEVWCNMEFNRLEVRLTQTAIELEGILKPGDDLVELHWFDEDELSSAEQIPGGKEFFVEAGYLKA